MEKTETPHLIALATTDDSTCLICAGLLLDPVCFTCGSAPHLICGECMCQLKNSYLEKTCPFCYTKSPLTTHGEDVFVTLTLTCGETNVVASFKKVTQHIQQCLICLNACNDAYMSDLRVLKQSYKQLNIKANNLEKQNSALITALWLHLQPDKDFDVNITDVNIDASDTSNLTT